MYSVGKERIKQVGRDISPVSKEFPVDSLAEHSPYLRIPVIHVGPCKTEHYDLSPVVADEVQFESVAPSHRPLPVSGKTGENLVGIPAQVVAYGYHGGVHKCDACAASKRVEVQEEHHLEEHPALQFHKAIVGHRIRKVTLEMDTDEVQVVVLEIVECAEMEHNQNRPVGGFLFFLAKKLRPSLRVDNFLLTKK